MHRLRPALVALLVGLYLIGGAGRAWTAVASSPDARDFATYHYAAQVALDSGDPYDTPALSAAAQADGTRRQVHPFFYPPPALLGMVWVGPLSLSTAYKVWFFIQNACLLGILVVMSRWIGASPLLLAGVLATFTPLPDNLKMGQANLPVLLLAVVGLWRGSGLAMGAAGMAKMSPALFLAGWGAKGRWRSVGIASMTAVGLSILTLPLVGFDSQFRFFTEILPGFSSGEYHGLKVPITLPANHSIPDLLNQLWPGPDRHHLDPKAALATKLLSLGLLAGLVPVFRRARGPLGEACAFGALAVLLTITPVYAYEHHLAFLLLPVIALGVALERGVIARGWWAAAAPVYFFIAWPLYMLRPAQGALPAMHWAFQESKFFGALGLAGLCVYAAWRTGGAPNSGADRGTPTDT